MILSFAWLDPVVADAVTVTVVFEATLFAVTMNVAVYMPAGTVTLFGTDATAALLTLSLTSSPLLEAGLLRLMVPTTVPPPATEAGLSVNTSGDAGAGVIVRAALFPPPKYVPEMFAVIVWETLPVETRKFADWLPAATTTVDGTEAAELSEDSWTDAPPFGAGCTSVTVPVVGPPPGTLEGLRATFATPTGGTTVRVAVSDGPG